MKYISRTVLRSKAYLLTFKALVENFFQQKTGVSLSVILIVFVLGIIFAFVHSNPVLLPLVYPLF